MFGFGQLFTREICSRGRTCIPPGFFIRLFGLAPKEQKRITCFTSRIKNEKNIRSFKKLSVSYVGIYVGIFVCLKGVRHSVICKSEV